MSRRYARPRMRLEQLEQRSLLAITPLQLSSDELNVHMREIAPTDDGVFFVAEQDDSNELWWSDGSRDGGRLITTAVSPQIGNPAGLLATGTKVFFPAFTDATGDELGVSDGTVDGTTVIDISPGQVSSSISRLTVANGRAIFLGPSLSQGEQQFWISDGTQSGTRVIEGALADVESWLGVGDTFWFVKTDSSNPSQLWNWNGEQESSPQLVGQLPSSATLSQLQNITQLGSSYVFTYLNDLWFTDLTPEGTQSIKQFTAVEPMEFTVSNGNVYFVASNDAAADPIDERMGNELWKTNGTPWGTRLVADIHPGSESSGIRSLAAAGDTVVFFADDGGGSHLWTSDGTADGTDALLELTSGFRGSSQSYEGVAYFSAETGLWRSDGTTEGTYEVIDGQVSSNIQDSPYVVMRPGQLWGLVPSHTIDLVEFPEIAVVDTPADFMAHVMNNLGDQLTYEWDFGDGSTPISSIDEVRQTHTFDELGRFDFNLSVTNSDGAVESFSATLAVIDSSPTLIYDSLTGGLSLESPRPLKSFTIRSAGGLLTGEPTRLVGGTIVDRDDRISRFDPAGFSYADLGFVAQAGLTEEQLLTDVTIGVSSLEAPEVKDAKIVWKDDAEVILTYDTVTGELQSRTQTRLTTLELRSSDEVFEGVRPTVMTSRFDVYRPEKLFRLSGDGADLIVDYGPAVQTGLSAEYLTSDWAIDGSLLGVINRGIESYTIVDANRVGQLLDEPPIPFLEDASIVEGEDVSLDATGTIDPDTDDESLTYSWLINGIEVLDADEGILTLDWTTLSTQYLSPETDGNFDVEVFVSDGTSNESTTGALQVTNASPSITTFNFVDSGLVSKSLHFIASAEDVGGDLLSFEWDFGDGDFAEGAEVTHAYSTAGDYTVRLSVSDGSETTETTGKISIRANAAPTAEDDETALTAGETTDLTEHVLTNDSDPDGDAIAIVDADPLSLLGAVVSVIDGRLYYDPTSAETIQSLPQGAVAFDRFQYSIEDESGGSATAMVSVEVTVEAENLPPIVPDGFAFTFWEREPELFWTSSTFEATDPEAETLTFEWDLDGDGVYEIPDNGDGSPSERPFADFSDHDPKVVGVRVTDAYGNVVEATGTATLINEAPCLSISEVVVDHLNVQLWYGGGDVDPVTVDIDWGDGTTSHYEGLTGLCGRYSQAYIDFFPHEYEQPGTYQIEFVADDLQGGRSTEQLEVTTTAPLDARDDEYAIAANEELIVNQELGLLSNDTPGPFEIVPIVKESLHGGSVSIQADGSFVYTPIDSATFKALMAGETIEDNFSYSIHGTDGETDTAEVRVVVTGVDDQPVAVDDAISVNENSGRVDITEQLLANDFEFDEGDQISIVSVNASQTDGRVQFDGTNVSYDPTGAFESLVEGQTGIETFSYQISDSAGQWSTATVILSVIGVKREPGEHGSGIKLDIYPGPVSANVVIHGELDAGVLMSADVPFHGRQYLISDGTEAGTRFTGLYQDSPHEVVRGGDEIWILKDGVLSRFDQDGQLQTVAIDVDQVGEHSDGTLYWVTEDAQLIAYADELDRSVTASLPNEGDEPLQYEFELLGDSVITSLVAGKSFQVLRDDIVVYESQDHRWHSVTIVDGRFDVRERTESSGLERIYSSSVDAVVIEAPSMDFSARYYEGTLYITTTWNDFEYFFDGSSLNEISYFSPTPHNDFEGRFCYLGDGSMITFADQGIFGDEPTHFQPDGSSEMIADFSFAQANSPGAEGLRCQTVNDEQLRLRFLDASLTEVDVLWNPTSGEIVDYQEPVPEPDPPTVFLRHDEHNGHLFVLNEEPYELIVEKRKLGDVNHDRVFDSSDLIQMLSFGEYEDDLIGNSTYQSGDVNGDGEFDSADLIDMFMSGEYVI